MSASKGGIVSIFSLAELSVGIEHAQILSHLDPALRRVSPGHGPRLLDKQPRFVHMFGCDRVVADRQLCDPPSPATRGPRSGSAIRGSSTVPRRRASEPPETSVAHCRVTRRTPSWRPLPERRRVHTRCAAPFARPRPVALAGERPRRHSEYVSRLLLSAVTARSKTLQSIAMRACAMRTSNELSAATA